MALYWCAADEQVQAACRTNTESVVCGEYRYDQESGPVGKRKGLGGGEGQAARRDLFEGVRAGEH